MCRRWRWPRAKGFLAALLLWGMAGGVARAQGVGGPTPAADAAQRLVLAVSLDGGAVGEPVLVRRQGGRLWLRAADLRAIGIAAKGDGEVALSAIAGLTAAIDAATQTLVLTRTGGVQRVSVDDEPARAVAMSSNGWGMAVNYDLTAASAGRRTSGAGLVDAVVYGPRGYFYAGALVGAGDGPRRFVRLDTGFTTGDPDAARRVTVGDLINGATETSRPVRMGGIQIATDFGLRPDLVTFPVPAIDGTAAAPSALDLIVNGSRRAAGRVRAGQFAVSDVPVQTGVNTITVAVRDALGRETRQTVSTYVARTLLRTGLTAFSAEIGRVRTGYASAADRYGALAGSGSLRVGLNDRLTAEAHGEIAGRVGVATGGASVGLGRLGLLSVSVGASVAAAPERHGGLELAAGYERIGRPFSVAVHYVRHNRGWYDLAADGGATTRAHALTMTLGLDLGRGGTVGLTAIAQGAGRVARRVGGGRPFGPDLPATTLATATYSVRVARRLNLIATVGGDAQVRRSAYASIGAVLVIGRRSSGYAGVLARAGGLSGNAEWGQTAIEPGDVGYHLAAARGGIDRVAADLSYQGASGFYAAQVERTNGAYAGRLSARGAVVVGREGVLLADRLTDSFAVIDTRGQAGVPVYRDNRRVGVTDRRGRLLIANLPAYQPTKIALDPVAIDPAIAFDDVERWVRLAARVGVPVRFALRPLHGAAIVRLIDPAGVAIPAGARAIANGGPAAPIGLDGMLYVETLAPANRVVVQLRGGGGCAAEFAAAAPVALLTRIGPVVCRPE